MVKRDFAFSLALFLYSFPFLLSSSLGTKALPLEEISMRVDFGDMSFFMLCNFFFKKEYQNSYISMR